MDTPNQSFINAVKKSRVLNAEQKQELLTNPEVFPDSYKARLITLLSEFDDHSKIRERYLHENLQQSYDAFAKKLRSDGVEEEKREELLAKARHTIDSMFPRDAA